MGKLKFKMKHQGSIYKSQKHQIKIFKEAGAPNLQGTIPKYANDKRQALVNAVELYEEGVWVTGSAEDWESESEEFGFEDIDNDTSDTDTD